MIKNLLDADDETPMPPPPNMTTEKKDLHLPTREMPAHDKSESTAPVNLPREVFEIPQNTKFFTSMSDGSGTSPESSPVQTDPIEDLRETEMVENPQARQPNETNSSGENISEQHEKTESAAAAAPVFQSNFKSETPDETIRKSGMAYSAAIVLVASIVFTMLLGWFADLLLGSKPFGIVAGIILGAIIGFIQFFRITSSILK